MHGYLMSIELDLPLISLERKKLDLIVRLTDDTDPFFLYTLTIGEEDFQSLKTQQGLLVEFSAFPQRFIDLLEQCIREQDKEMPRFLLQLVTSSTVMDRIPANLNVIETNPFKHLTHLSLKLLPANDTDVKKYLAVCLRNMKMERNSLDDRLHRSEEDLNKRLSITQQTLAEKSKELDRLRNEWTSHSSLMSNKHSQEVTTEREKSLQAQRQYQLQWEQQKKEMEIAHSRTVQHLESRLAELETINKDLTERRYKSESSIRELKAKLLGMEEECQRSKQEILSLRRENSTLDAECHEKEKLLNQLRTRTAVLEQEVKDKEQVVTRTTEVFESTQEHKKNLEGSLEQKQQQNRKLEATVKSLSEELLKANEIIKKLQGDMKKLMEKIKLKNTVTMQQEKLIGEKTQTIQKEQMELREVQQSLRLKEEEMSKQQEHLEATVQKLEESKQLLKTNENGKFYECLKSFCIYVGMRPDFASQFGQVLYILFYFKLPVMARMWGRKDSSGSNKTPRFLTGLVRLSVQPWRLMLPAPEVWRRCHEPIRRASVLLTLSWRRLSLVQDLMSDRQSVRTPVVLELRVEAER
uniref:Spindle assembly abnormal protein 6 homolog n=1 Tax=Callorhinchus milii TaxID=7868 RepID=A0A4W3IGK2_CALMI